MDDMLSLCAHLPEVTFEPGTVIVREGERIGAIWVLVSGTTQVFRNGVPVNLVTEPGALIGEISVLLGRPYGATVIALGRCVARHARDGQALLASDPAIVQHLARGLAERLSFVTDYLADLKRQYGDAPGIDMVPEILNRIAMQPRAAMRPGSAREPDPEY